MGWKTKPHGDPNPPAPSPTKCNGGPAPVVTPRKRQPVILKDPAPLTTRCAEVACGTVVSCATVCCCCPCGLLSLIVLATVRLPAGLCRRALRARKNRLEAAKKQKEAAILGSKGAANVAAEAAAAAGGGIAAVDQMEKLHREEAAVGDVGGGFQEPKESPWAVEVAEIEKEMSAAAGTGFWRSPSQRDEKR